MLGKTFWLTLATLLGLTGGFAREWLLVTAWGAGQTSDAFLVALFLPEALRMTLAGGLLASAALPLYLQRNGAGQSLWFNGLFPVLFGCSLLVSLGLIAGASVWVQLMGPGLGANALAQAADNLRLLALSIPAFLAHALFSIPLHARERFILAGLGSLLFNLPPVIYLWLAGSAAGCPVPGVLLRPGQPADGCQSAAGQLEAGLAALAHPGRARRRAGALQQDGTAVVQQCSQSGAGIAGASGGQSAG